MILVEMPFAFACLVFVVGIYMTLVDIFYHKQFDGDMLKMSLGGFVFGFIYLLIIKYTFIEGIVFQCSEIEWFCR
jgi:hypothetical protein|tara:strand:- start:245 stop:469 length:225 start_codon:yes stop_codon:yes gene_type:complete